MFPAKEPQRDVTAAPAANPVASNLCSHLRPFRGPASRSRGKQRGQFISDVEQRLLILRVSNPLWHRLQPGDESFVTEFEFLIFRGLLPNDSRGNSMIAFCLFKFLSEPGDASAIGIAIRQNPITFVSQPGDEIGGGNLRMIVSI